MSSLIDEIREYHAQRRATLKMQLRIDNNCRAQARRYLGWQTDLPEKEREAIAADAASVVEAVQKDKPLPDHLADAAAALATFCLTSRESRRPFDACRRNVERRMTKAVMSLPVWPWVEAVKGFGPLGLAIIIGEAGDLSAYANPGKLWKRMGLAVIDGKAQGKRTDREEAARHGYDPQRRSAFWTITDSLLKQRGPFKDMYDARKAYELARDPEMTKIHAHRRAQRFAGKRLLRDLWTAWRAAGHSFCETQEKTAVARQAQPAPSRKRKEPTHEEAARRELLAVDKHGDRRNGQRPGPRTRPDQD